MSSSQVGTASSAATIPPTEEVKPPAKKRGRPPNTHKVPSTGTIPASNASQVLPKKRGRPPREKNESPLKPTTDTSKKQKKRVKDRHQPYKPTDAELAHLEIPSYRVDPEDGRLFWTLPDGAEPEYLPHPGRGKKYQWGFEYSSLPEDYKGDDSDAGWQRWLNAKYQNSIGYDQGSYPLGEDEDAEGEGDELDAARGLTVMDTSYDPESSSPTYDRHNGSPLPPRSLFDNEMFQNAQESTKNQSTGKNSTDMNPLKEIQKPQPLAGESSGSATAPNEHGGPARKLPRGELPQGERREETRWSRWNPKIRERECFVGRLPPPRLVPRKPVMSATG
ncbi:MAG: hypothetical protein L6R38_003592 [Xanthoria sp. 2 TBL-2021]|nr:MAG: hypothetical protein L6R38_003592 [Xanthoria sp. 2 TBL-2021]